MEETCTGTQPPAISTVDASTADASTSSRRKGGSQKRKASTVSGGGNTSTPQTSKRQAREKLPPVPFPPIHNGPLTRARQQPTNSAAAAVSPLPFGAKSELVDVAPTEAGGGGGEIGKADELNDAAKDDCEALEARIEADYEAIRSRDSNAHVVPNHAGWFSWTKTHPLEEKSLPSFFNGKSDSRTPEIYMEIRNWIMKKFHKNPNIQVELKDLSESSVGDLAARQEVMEFLDYWGLINYHPFPEMDVTTMVDTGDADKTAKTDSLLESLFRFESEQSFVPVVPRNRVTTPSVPAGLFPESSIVEELGKSEGPSVDYHCNSCAADCSRKRYHCQKQADFDLCSECFNNGMFSSDMSPSDFIIMEPAEVGGASGGNWTDQENLLLLEALELFSENWNEIAEHVATKTKAQCILHFVQMPIEDTFLDSHHDIDHIAKGNLNVVSNNNDTSASKDGPEVTESKDKGSEVTEGKDKGPEVTESKDKANEDKSPSPTMESSKREEVNGSTIQGLGQNFALKALSEAFGTVASLPSPGERLSFAEAGNPVMILAAFLVRLLEPNIVTAFARSSLKSISGNLSGYLLALRHCFCLEDPPDDKKSAHSERADTEIAEEDTPKSEQNDEKLEDSDSPTVDAVYGSKEKDQKDNKDCVVEKGGTLASPSLASINESASAKDLNEVTNGEPEAPHFNLSNDSDLPKEQVSVAGEKSDDLTMEVEVPPGFEKNPDAAALSGEPSEPVEVPECKETVPDLKIKDPVQPTTLGSVTEVEANEGAEAKTFINDEKSVSRMSNDLTANRIKSAVVTALSAVAVKAKLLADQEEQQIHRLAAHLIEKQLYKLETKLAFFNDMDNVVMRVQEQLERSKQRLFHERAQIIATRLGISASRPMAQSLPINRVAMAFANSVPRPNIGSSQPSNQDQLSSVGTK